MKQEILVDSETTFYLATDCKETKMTLQRLFQDRIISRKRDLARGSRAGGRDAVIDLYSLSYTNKLLGSYWSSFSDTAAELRGIKKIICKDEPAQP